VGKQVISLTFAGLDAGLLPVPDDEIRRWHRFPANQQPRWEDQNKADEVVRTLAGLPGLVGWDEVQTLRRLLAEVATGELQVMQAGDCAEEPAQCVPEHLAARVALLETLAGRMSAGTGTPTLMVGRIAGQFAKPRSEPTEKVGDRRLPAFRGPMVNGPVSVPTSRRPEPTRMLTCYHAARTATVFLRGHSRIASTVWTSHEALVLDYELPLVRRHADGALLLTSTHWPWIGERTRQLDGAHVTLLSEVENPIACKVGPDITESELLRLCERLDPHREPGRLTLIVRHGASRAAERIPGLVKVVLDTGYPVIWLCDPMHGNTVTTPAGLKTRAFTAVAQEINEFCTAVTEAGGVAGGLHLETTPDPVAECVWEPGEIDVLTGKAYTTLCDQRLDREQTCAAVNVWAAERKARR